METERLSNELQTAIRANDEEAVRELLKEKPKLANAVDPVRKETTLGQAVEQNTPVLAKILIENGASVNTPSAGRPPLIRAIQLRNTETVALLLAKGAAVNVTDRNRSTPLHEAVGWGNVDLVRRLLERGAVVDAVSDHGGPPLQVAVSKLFLDIVQLLVSHGADVSCALAHLPQNATLMHVAASKGDVRMIDYLMTSALDVDAVDDYGWSLLHYTASCNQATVIVPLLDKGLLVDTRNYEAQTALHVAASSYAVEVVRVLLEYGSDVNALDELDMHPLLFAVLGETDERALDREIECVRLLILHGATWNRSFDELLHQERVRCQRKDHEIERLLALIREWVKQRDSGRELTVLPVEVYIRGADDIQAFFKTAGKSATTLYRKKLCVVGPNEYPSSHSLFYSKRTLYVVCVNLEVYKHALEQANLLDRPGIPHVEMDRFVATTIYRWIRSICGREPESEFVFVGTKADLINHETQTADAVMRDLLTRIDQREAQEKKSLARELHRLREERSGVSAQSLTVLDSQLLDLELRSTRRPRFLSRKLYFTSSADLNGIDAVREALEQCIVTSDSSFPMPDTYCALETLFKSESGDDNARASVSERIKSSFVQSSALREMVRRESSLGLDDGAELTTALHVMHDLGDILWFDSTRGVLATAVFLSPDLVIDFIRQVINHRFVDEVYVATMKGRSRELFDRVREEGCVPHELMERLELWRDLDDQQLMLQLKLMLSEFQLAYSAGSCGMTADSDLIVPLYWKNTSSNECERAQLVKADWPYRVRWEYEFQEHLPDEFYEKLGVISYSAYYSTDRVFTSDSFKTFEENQYETEVCKQYFYAEDEWTSDFVVLSVSTGASSQDLVWKQLQWYALNIEKLLESYPGLWVKRFVVSTTGKRFALDMLVAQMQQTKMCPSGDLLPPNMDWYTQKVWQDSDMPTDLSEEHGRLPSRTAIEQLIESVNCMRVEVNAGFQDTKNCVEQAKRTIVQVQAAAGNRLVYPALWTLEYHADENDVTRTLTIKFRSELSGKCFHDDKPIVITVGSEFLGKYGGYIKAGLSIFASVFLMCLASPSSSRLSMRARISWIALFKSTVWSKDWIRISHAENLPNSRRMGTQSPYCVWRLLNADQYELATGRTPQHRNGGQTPQWGMHEFYVDVANQNIDDCGLFFTIKTPAMLPGTSLTIADGWNGLRDLSKTSDWQAAISPLNTKGHPAGKLQFLIKWSTR
ncbi:hypothetical protein Poli38472_013285 [Pythium oligandrum]|uniref:C2 domain-containing protein n=1 Tax=Pythium oligandrum TaxID=41045 RepID=A0A8K1FC21_PYTOL|nr:hypothetical protein Poli38472_013285 [Pythium oligandrum]|eukprot:TMW55394.1 hypothetical protein Poli38472_013285 [Pythium oligandrum]